MWKILPKMGGVMIHWGAWPNVGMNRLSEGLVRITEAPSPTLQLCWLTTFQTRNFKLKKATNLVTFICYWTLLCEEPIALLHYCSVKPNHCNQQDKSPALATVQPTEGSTEPASGQISDKNTKIEHLRTNSDSLSSKYTTISAVMSCFPHIMKP